MTAVRRRRDASPRSGCRCGPGAGSAHEKVERRAGDWAIAAASGGGLDRRRTRSPTPASASSARRPDDDRADARGGAAARRHAVGGAVRRRRRAIASEDCTPIPDTRGPVDYKRHLAGVLTKRALRRATARALAAGGLTDAGDDHHQRRAGLARRRAAHAARPLHPRHAGPDRDALGLRHVELRRVRRADGRQAGEVVHDAGGDVRGPRDPHRRVARGRRPARPDPAGLPRDARAAVRLLHARDADDRRARCSTRTRTRPTQEIRTAISGGDLPLHGLQEHRRRGPVGRRARGATRQEA